VFLPEPHAGADAHGVDEAAAVHAPVLGRAFGGRQHQLGHRPRKRAWPMLGAPIRGPAPALCQVVGKLHGVVALGMGVLPCTALLRLAFGGFLGLGACGYCASSYQSGSRKQF
jgi:hypothetical protein